MRLKVAAAGALVIAGCLVLAAGCGTKQKTLHVYNWADYVKPELIQRFEKDNHCKVVTDTFDSNEAMYAKVKAGAAGYDLIFPSNYMVDIMRLQGMLQPLNHAWLPNLANIDPLSLKLVSDTKFEVSVPYLMSYTGIAYLKSKVQDAKPSSTMFERADLKGRMTMLNDMREVIGAALKVLGYSLNSTDDRQLGEARDLAIKWKKNLAKFENEQYKSGLASGEFQLVQGYSGDIMQVQEENKDIEFALPVEGVSVACDLMVIPKDAKEVELAHKFINFMHDPKVAAENIEFVFYLCPNAKAYEFLKPETRQNPAIFLPPAIQDKSETIHDLGKDNAKYTKIWDEIKAAN